MEYGMKKLLIPAFVCTAAMFTACGDDSSSANNEVVESSSSVAAESRSSNVAESSSSDWAHESVGGFLCASASDSTAMLRYEYEGADSAMEVVSYVYPRVYEMYEDVDKVCEEANANKTAEQKVICKTHVTIINPLKTMSFDALVSLMEKECEAGSIMITLDLVDPDEAPENFPSINPAVYCKNHQNSPLCKPYYRSN